MRRILVVLLLALGVAGVSAAPASGRGGSHPHFNGSQHFRSFRHGSRIESRLRRHYHFRHLRAVRHPHSIIFFPRFVLPSSACDPVRIPGRWFWTGHEWVWATEYWGCR